MTSPRRLRVFLASPGDVGEERALARQILSELPYDALVNWRVVFEVVAWDQPRSGPPLLATMTPQAAIEAGMPRPSECDVVGVILWRRSFESILSGPVRPLSPVLPVSNPKPRRVRGAGKAPASAALSQAEKASTGGDEGDDRGCPLGPTPRPA
jgi:hypothetical protein